MKKFWNWIELPLDYSLHCHSQCKVTFGQLHFIALSVDNVRWYLKWIQYCFQSLLSADQGEWNAQTLHRFSFFGSNELDALDAMLNRWWLNCINSRWPKRLVQIQIAVPGLMRCCLDSRIPICQKARWIRSNEEKKLRKHFNLEHRSLSKKFSASEGQGISFFVVWWIKNRILTLRT